MAGLGSLSAAHVEAICTGAYGGLRRAAPGFGRGPLDAVLLDSVSVSQGVDWFKVGRGVGGLRVVVAQGARLCGYAGEMLVDEADDHRSLADGGCAALR